MRSITELADFREPLLMAQNTGHRLMLVLAMAEERGITQAQQLTHLGSSGLWVDVQEIDPAELIDHQHITAAQASLWAVSKRRPFVFYPMVAATMATPSGSVCVA